MKKFIVLSLFGLMIIALSGMAHAQKLDFQISGYISTTTKASGSAPGEVPFGGGGVGGTTDSIVTPFAAPFQPPTPGVFTANSGAWNRTSSYVQSRAYLVLDMVMSKELSGRVALEIDSLQWGGFAGATGDSAGFRTSDRNNMGFWTEDRASVEVKSAYITAGLPYFGIPAPMTVNVGMQPIGARPWVFQYTDGAGITGAIKADPVTIIPFWGKAVEGKNFSADDSDEYGLHVNAKVGTFTVGAYGVNFNMNTYPLSRATLGVNPEGTNAVGGVNSFKADFWWWGAYADGKLGPLDVQWDFVYDKGKVETKTTNLIKTGFPSGASSDVDYRGWVTRAKVNYPWEQFNFGAAGAYATGADLRKTSNTGLPGSAVSDPGFGFSKKVGSYVVPPGAENPGANDDLIIFGHFIGAEASPFQYAPGPGIYPNQVHRGSYGGTWFLKTFAGYKATPWYKISLEGLYIGDNTKHGNTFGNAVKTGTTTRRDDGKIGWELNLINEINIYKNLKWDIGFGYIWAGPALDQAVPKVGGFTANINKSPDNPFALLTKLRYSF